MTTSDPKVSVSIVTYNHAKYVAQALDSALMQQTNFAYEILVGEDDSSDGTREIAMTYAQEYPDKIRLFLNERKNVIYINGRPTGRWNFMNNLKQARGEYIALLDGDDYWTSAHKLQKQVDFLEAHPGYSFCFHPVNMIDEQGDVIREDYGVYKRSDTYTFDDILHANFVPAGSVVFRAGIQSNLPDWFSRAPVADWTLHLLNARQGKIGFINETMAVIRRHSAGIWGGLSRIERFESDIRTYALLAAHLGLRNTQGLKNALGLRHLWIAQEYRKVGKLPEARAAALRSFQINPFDRQRKALKLLKELYFPFLSRIFTTRIKPAK